MVMKTDYADLTGPSTSQGPPGSMPPARSYRYAPNPAILPQDCPKPWYTTASNTLTDTDIMVISEWLQSGGTYTLYIDPAHWVKLLLDQETARSFDRMLLEKASSNQFININILMDVLYELITSKRSLKSRRKALFNMYNKPMLMGKEGDKLDTLVSQISRNI